MLSNTETFNGNNTSGTSTTGYVYTSPNVIYDRIEYCPYCGKKLPTTTDEIHYCPFCGKAIPRTYTNGPYVIHWNNPDGTVTWPRDGIVQPNVIC